MKALRQKFRDYTILVNKKRKSKKEKTLLNSMEKELLGAIDSITVPCPECEGDSECRTCCGDGKCPDCGGSGQCSSCESYLKPWK